MSKYGFTLVELAIVLVIIGLLVGAIVAGTELVETSKLNRQINEWEKLKTGFTTYTMKYGVMPGDDGRAASRFSGATNSNRPDKILGSVSGGGAMAQYTNGGNLGGRERCLVFQHLYLSGVFPLLLPDCTTSAPRANTSLPALLGSVDAFYWITDPNIPGSGFATAGEKQICTGVPYTPTWGYGELASVKNATSGYEAFPLRITQAHYFDQKLDDGMATTGKIKALAPSGGGSSVLCSQTDNLLTANNTCKLASGAYYLSNNANSGCVLSIKMGF